MYTCAEMTSSEIASLNLVVDAKNVKTFCTIKRLCKHRGQPFHQYQQHEQ